MGQLRSLSACMAAISLLYPMVASASSNLTVTNCDLQTTLMQAPSTSVRACNQLSIECPSQVIFPNSTQYVTENTAYWDIRSDKSPVCVFLPEVANDVEKGLKIIVANDAHFAVRGGGHMNYPGSNNIDGGVLMPLSKLNDIVVHKDTVDIGPGNRLIDVYSALEPYGRVAIGGRLKTIGASGLLLIGGFHYFNNKYGFGMDNVVSYDVVLGNGTKVTANAYCHPDLFWALKGGANNYGIVTKFTLKTYEVPQISTTIQTFNETEVYAFIKATCDLALVDDGIAAGGVISITYNVTTGEVSPSILGVQAGVSVPPSQFANYTAIPGITKLNNVTTAAQWASGLDSPDQMFRVMFSHRTIKPDADALFATYQAWKKGIDSLSDVEGLYPTFVMNILSKGAARVGRTNGIGNTWGLEEEAVILWQFSTGWANAQDDIRVTSWSRQLVEQQHGIHEHKGLASPFVYMGDAGEWQDPFQGFPKENVERMKNIRAEYDTQGVFSKLNWGGFKLGP